MHSVASRLSSLSLSPSPKAESQATQLHTLRVASAALCSPAYVALPEVSAAREVDAYGGEEEEKRVCLPAHLPVNLLFSF